MLGFVVSPQTLPPSPVQSVPVGAGSNVGVDGDPEQVGLVKHTELEKGMSVGSSTGVVPPEPLQTIFWQSPGD
jgi:hypothetical protein